MARKAASSTTRQKVSTAMKLSIAAGAHISFISYLSYLLGWTWHTKQILAFLPLEFLLIFFTGGELFARHIAKMASISLKSEQNINSN
jgi:hypothetical protein